jgi:hypothetical protein
VQRVRTAMEPHLFVRERPPVLLGTELGDLGGATGAALLAERRLAGAATPASAAVGTPPPAPTPPG